MKHLLDSCLLVRGVKVWVSLGVSDEDFSRLLIDQEAMRGVMQDLGHDIANLLPHRKPEVADAATSA